MTKTQYVELPPEAVLGHVKPGMYITSAIQNAALLRALDAGEGYLEDVTIHHMDPWETATATWSRWTSLRCRRHFTSSPRRGWQ
jgi:hypothetical protein